MNGFKGYGRFINLGFISLLVLSCHSVAVTRVPDAPPAEADRPVTTGQDTKTPGPQQTKGVVIGKWRLAGISGGYTGKGAPVPPDNYYRFTADSFYIDRNGVVEKGKYERKEVKDLHTGLPVYLMTGLQWTFTAEGPDTLHADANVYDGYNYLLVRVK